MTKINTIKKDDKYNHGGSDFDTYSANVSEISPKQYQANEDMYNSAPEGKYIDQCTVCAKGIKSFDNVYSSQGDGHPLILTRRTQYYIVEKSGGFMGTYFIGPECGRQIKVQMKADGLNWKEWLGHRTNNKELSHKEENQ